MNVPSAPPLTSAAGCLRDGARRPAGSRKSPRAQRAPRTPRLGLSAGYTVAASDEPRERDRPVAFEGRAKGRARGDRAGTTPVRCCGRSWVKLSSCGHRCQDSVAPIWGIVFALVAMSFVRSPRYWPDAL